MDAKSRRALWATLKRQRRGRVILVSTHSMDEADAISDRIAIMVRTLSSMYTLCIYTYTQYIIHMYIYTLDGWGQRDFRSHCHYGTYIIINAECNTGIYMSYNTYYMIHVSYITYHMIHVYYMIHIYIYVYMNRAEVISVRIAMMVCIICIYITYFFVHSYQSIHKMYVYTHICIHT